MQPLPPWGIGAPCWFPISKRTAIVVEGVSEQNFQETVPPMPISTSLTDASFRLAETQGPIAPEILSSREHFTSMVPPNAILLIIDFFYKWKRLTTIIYYLLEIVTPAIFNKNALKRLLEKCRIEAISHNHMASESRVNIFKSIENK